MKQILTTSFSLIIQQYLISKKNRITNLLILLLTSTLLISCRQEEEEVTGPSAKSEISTTMASASSICGTVNSFTLFAGRTIDVGAIEVSNDLNNLYITYKTKGGWMIQETHLYVGTRTAVPVNRFGNPMIGHFPIKSVFSPHKDSFTYSLSLSSLPSCFIVAAHAVVVKKDAAGNIVQKETAWGNGTRFVSRGSWATFSNYCKQSCATCSITAEDFRTQTQGGWGSTPKGDNPGTYLHNNFSRAFPKGLTIGGKNNILLTSASAVTAFLPQGGPAASLRRSFVDPKDVNNVLAGQLTALTLSVTFDNYDANFSKSAVSLASLRIGSGLFKGMKVVDILSIGNKVLAGETTAYTPSDINNVVSMINENFVDGQINNGNLVCQ